MNPSSPVAQNGQPTAQPAWLETQTVARGPEPRRGSAGERISTASTLAPSERVSSSFVVAPSSASCRSTSSKALKRISLARRSWSGFPSVVTPLQEVATDRHAPSRICVTRYDSAPMSLTRAASWFTLRSERLRGRWEPPGVSVVFILRFSHARRVLLGALARTPLPSCSCRQRGSRGPGATLPRRGQGAARRRAVRGPLRRARCPPLLR